MASETAKCCTCAWKTVDRTGAAACRHPEVSQGQALTAVYYARTRGACGPGGMFWARRSLLNRLIAKSLGVRG